MTRRENLMKIKNKFHALRLLAALAAGLSAAPGIGQTNPPLLRIVSSNNVATVLWTNHFDTNLVLSSGYYLLQMFSWQIFVLLFVFAPAVTCSAPCALAL